MEMNGFHSIKVNKVYIHIYPYNQGIYIRLLNRHYFIHIWVKGSGKNNQGPKRVNTLQRKPSQLKRIKWCDFPQTGAECPNRIRGGKAWKRDEKRKDIKIKMMIVRFKISTPAIKSKTESSKKCKSWPENLKKLSLMHTAISTRHISSSKVMHH